MITGLFLNVQKWKNMTMLENTNPGRPRTARKDPMLRKLLSLLAICMLGAWGIAQTPLNTDGATHRIAFDGSYQDFVIPDDPAITQVLLLARGGDGGIARVERESCTSPGGSGATLTLTIDIGYEAGQVPPSSRLRFIPGGRGQNGITRSDVLGTGFAYGGGGGGTGLLYETPDSAVWQILAVAGGGGGAYVGRAVGFCVNNGSPAAGQGGRDWIAAGDGKGGFLGGDGGTFGDGGRRSEFAGGGGGFLTGGDGVTCIELSFPFSSYQAGAGQKGYPEGGRGGLDDDCIDVLRINAGGFGFGGGGAGWGAGGGGGGYSGGGAGATTGGGGGGGSYVAAIASSRTIAAGANTLDPADGYIEYQVIRKQADAPLAQCRESLNIVIGDDGLAIIDPNTLDNGSSDANGEALTFSADQDAFGCGETGEHIITLTVSNESGLSSQCNALVTVSDTQAPTLSCPEGIEVENAEGACGAPVELTELVSVTDNCDAILSYSHLPGYVFEVGETEVTVTATDAGGNEALCSFTVRVMDTKAPQITCPEDIRANAMAGDCGAPVDFSELIATADDCEVTLHYSHPPGSVFDIGETEVTVTASDASENEAACTFSVKIMDTEAPVITCPDDIAISCTNASGPEIAGMASATDNCDGPPRLSYEDVTTGDCKLECATQRTWTAMDAQGNASSCVQTITQGSREIIAEALTRDLDADGEADPIVLGYSNRTLTIGEDALDCVMDWLPHTGGPGAPLPRGSGQYTVDPADCLPGGSPLSEDGRLQNRLLGEVLQLSIKLRQTPELADLPVRDLNCQFSVMAQQTLRPSSTVGSILRLGNITLANLYGPFYEPIASAIQCINNQFPLCEDGNATMAMARSDLNLPQETTVEKAFRLYPNPAGAELFIDAPALRGKAAVLRIYNLQGQLTAEQRITEWPAAPLRLNLDSRWRGIYLANILADEKAVYTKQFVVEAP